MSTFTDLFTANPIALLYFVIFPIALGIAAYIRISNERKTFHFRVFDRYQDVRNYFFDGILAALILNIVIGAIGIVVPKEMSWLLLGITIIGSLSMFYQFINAAFLFGIVIVATGVLRVTVEAFYDVSMEHIASVALLGGLVLYAESWLLNKSANKSTYPLVLQSKRGRNIGAHLLKALWLLPLIVYLPSGTLQTPLAFGSLQQLQEGGGTLALLPLAVGAILVMQGNFPERYIKVYAQRTRLFAVIGILLALVSIFVPLLAPFVGVFYLLGWLYIRYRMSNEDLIKSPVFTNSNEGIVVLAILPNSPAAELGIQPGERIVRVNGNSVQSVEQFYTLLDANRAQAKLELLTQDGELRFVNRATYANEHHELGFLWVKEERILQASAI
ncbi:MAG: PDZ domain-containing protein [Bacilli bacterium]